MNIKLFTYSGIPVYTDVITLALIGLFIFAGPLGITTSLSMAVVLFGSILLHEFGHALTAQRIGYRVEQIHLMIMGGMAKIEDMQKLNPRQEILVSGAGPAVNAVLALTSWVLLVLLPITWTPVFILGTLEFIAKVNFMLAVFNILPVFPLDGGRIAKALFTDRHGVNKGARYMWWLSLVLGSCLVAFAIWAKMYSLIFFMIYMLVAARGEYERATTNERF